MKTIKVSRKVLELCFVKAEHASDLDREQTANLMAWCDCQSEDLWTDMTLQEILNVYRVSAEWNTFEDWADADRETAHEAWNSAVIDPGNQMTKLEA